MHQYEFLCWLSVCMSWNPWTLTGGKKAYRLQTPSRGSEWYYRKWAQNELQLNFCLCSPPPPLSHSYVRSFPESLQSSPDGAAKAGLIHVLLTQAGAWRNEEVQGRSHQRNHHNSGVWHADNWLVAAINPDQEKRGYYMLWRRVMRCTLEIREVQGGHDAPYFLMEYPCHHHRRFIMYLSAWAAWASNEWGVVVQHTTSKMENVPVL